MTAIQNEPRAARHSELRVLAGAGIEAVSGGIGGLTPAPTLPPMPIKGGPIHEPLIPILPLPITQ